MKSFNASLSHLKSSNEVRPSQFPTLERSPDHLRKLNSCHVQLVASSVYSSSPVNHHNAAAPPNNRSSPVSPSCDVSKGDVINNSGDSHSLKVGPPYLALQLLLCLL